MNILYLTIAPKSNQKMTRDIAIEMVQNHHNVFIVCPADIENPSSRKFVLINGIRYLFVDSEYSVGKVGFVKKVIRFITIDGFYKKAIKKATRGMEIDLVLYSTPPITLINTVQWAKKHFQAKTYLMLKDIFPQNAVDMSMMKTSGATGLIYHFFRNKEKALYRVSDGIGCMSEANRKYILSNNSEIDGNRVGICVNSYRYEPLHAIDCKAVRERYGIPTDRTVFLYGGNLGKPQGLEYLVSVLRESQNHSDRFFVICGSGNDQKKVTDYIEKEQPDNVLYMSPLPPDEFDVLTCACDVGLVFLDYRFTIPNFPSRMLSIMLNAKPILAATDKNTDVNEMIADADCGWWCESTDVKPFNRYISEICKHPSLVAEKGKNARIYYETHFTSEIACRQILEGISEAGER